MLILLLFILIISNCILIYLVYQLRELIEKKEVVVDEKVYEDFKKPNKEFSTFWGNSN